MLLARFPLYSAPFFYQKSWIFTIFKGILAVLDPAGGHPPSENVAFLIISEGVKSNREIRKRGQKVGESM